MVGDSHRPGYRKLLPGKLCAAAICNFGYLTLYKDQICRHIPPHVPQQPTCLYSRGPPFSVITSISSVFLRLALLLCHMLLTIALKNIFSEASSANDLPDVGPPESSFKEPLPEDTPRICPLPSCKSCPTAKQIQAPGIGFALEMGYGYVVLPIQ